jgi:hypothetical protein
MWRELSGKKICERQGLFQWRSREGRAEKCWRGPNAGRGERRRGHVVASVVSLPPLRPTTKRPGPASPTPPPPALVAPCTALHAFVTLMSHKVKIAARLRPRLPGAPPHAPHTPALADGAQARSTTAGSRSSATTPAAPSSASPTRATSLRCSSSRACAGWLQPGERSAALSAASFSSCYDEHATQEAIFERDVRPLIDVVYSGVVRVRPAPSERALTSAADGHGLCLRRDLVRQDAHHAGDPQPARADPADRRGSPPPSCATEPRR